MKKSYYQITNYIVFEAMNKIRSDMNYEMGKNRRYSLNIRDNVAIIEAQVGEPLQGIGLMLQYYSLPQDEV